MVIFTLLQNPEISDPAYGELAEFAEAVQDPGVSVSVELLSVPIFFTVTVDVDAVTAESPLVCVGLPNRLIPLHVLELLTIAVGFAVERHVVAPCVSERRRVPDEYVFPLFVIVAVKPPRAV